MHKPDICYLQATTANADPSSTCEYAHQAHSRSEFRCLDFSARKLNGSARGGTLSGWLIMPEVMSPICLADRWSLHLQAIESETEPAPLSAGNQPFARMDHQLW